jgi:uncharacterized protein
MLSSTMIKDGLRYDKMVESALRGVVRDAIGFAVANGLPGGHHFYITFKTAAPGVEIGDHLATKYPDEMTIVIEHQFWDLMVGAENFAVTLSFNNRPERLTIPFAAITAFADPSVKFGLQFQETPQADAPAPAADARRPRLAAAPASPEQARPAKDKDKRTPRLVEETMEKPAAKDAAKKPGEVVTLDTFRKK